MGQKSVKSSVFSLLSRHYLSEKAFIDGLVSYNSDLYTGELKRIKEKEPQIDVIEEFGIKEIRKLED